MADELNGRVQEIEKSLGTLEADLREQVARVQSGTRTTLIVGIILIAGIFIYLTVLTTKISEWTQPENLAQAAAGFARGQVEGFETELKSQAPGVVKDLHKQILAQIPELRKFAEGKVLEAVDHFSEQFDTKVDGIVDEMLKMHVQELKPLIDAAVVPGNDKKLAEEFTQSLEELVGPKMDEVLQEYDRYMAMVSFDLDRLLEADDKTPSRERLGRDLVIAMMEYLDDFTRDPSMLLPTPQPPAGVVAPVAVPAVVPAPATPAATTAPAKAPAAPAKAPAGK